MQTVGEAGDGREAIDRTATAAGRSIGRLALERSARSLRLGTRPAVSQDDDLNSDIDGTMSYYYENVTEYPGAPHVAGCFG
jgi:hypothetical protein